MVKTLKFTFSKKVGNSKYKLVTEDFNELKNIFSDSHYENLLIQNIYSYLSI